MNVRLRRMRLSGTTDPRMPTESEVVRGKTSPNLGQ